MASIIMCRLVKMRFDVMHIGQILKYCNIAPILERPWLAINKLSLIKINSGLPCICTILLAQISKFKEFLKLYITMIRSWALIGQLPPTPTPCLHFLYIFFFYKKKYIYGNGATIRIGRESWCLAFAGFLFKKKIRTMFYEILHFGLLVSKLEYWDNNT